PRVAGVSAFGFGGTNCHVIVEEAPPAALPTETPAATETQPLTESGGPSLLLPSAPTRAHLDGYLERLAGHADEHATSAAELASGLVGRTAHRVRAAAIIDDGASVSGALRALVGAASSADERRPAEA